MIRKIIYLICLFGFIGPVYSQIEDPFKSLLPKEEEIEVVTTIEDIEDDVEDSDTTVDYIAPDINVEGILWNGKFPAAIIDGEVYKVGDILKEIKAKVYKVEKGAVFVFQHGKLYKFGIGTKGGR